MNIDWKALFASIGVGVVVGIIAIVITFSIYLLTGPHPDPVNNREDVMNILNEVLKDEAFK